MEIKSRSDIAVARTIASGAVDVENVDSGDLVGLAADARSPWSENVKGRLAAAELSDSLSVETVADSLSWRTVARTHLHPQLAAVRRKGERVQMTSA